MTKFKLTGNKIERDGHTLHQIQALIDIPERGVKAGDLGGYVEYTYNLNQTGKCWIYNGSCVYGGSSIEGDAIIGTWSTVCNQSRVEGCSKVMDQSKIENSKITSSVIECSRIVDKDVEFKHIRQGEVIRDFKENKIVKKLIEEVKKLDDLGKAEFMNELIKIGFYD